MPKFEIELWLDGYDSEEEMELACEEFIYDQLNFSASSVKIIKKPNNAMEQTADSDAKCTECGLEHGFHTIGCKNL